MSLVQTYLENNGYDYYGNAAEDTLVFFVHDEKAPVADDHNSDVPASDLITAPGLYVTGDFKNPTVNTAEMDVKQTDVQHSRRKDFEG